MSPLCESFLARRAARRDGAVLPAARAGLRRLLPGPARGVREPGAHLPRIRLFLVLLDDLGRARAALLRDDHASGSGSGRTASWSSWRATTATCCSISCRWACRCSASSRPPTCAKVALAQGHSDPGRVLRRRRSPSGCVAEGRQADLIVGNNVLAQVPDLNDFVAGMARLLEARRRDHARVPAPRAADRREPVRHHLPRALLVLLADHDRAPGRRATASS